MEYLPWTVTDLRVQGEDYSCCVEYETKQKTSQPEQEVFQSISPARQHSQNQPLCHTLEGQYPIETEYLAIESTSIKIATFNAENFYILLDKEYSQESFEALAEPDYQAMNTSIYNPNKERFKVAAVAETILENEFDFIGLCEVGGIETLENFNKHYLHGLYDCHLYEENSRRGIFVGALVKRGVFSRVTASNVRGNFSRNVLRVTLSRGTHALQVFVVHLKSQYGQDRGIRERIEEIRQLCNIVSRSRCIVLGDFNGIVIRGETEFEFEPFLELPFRDILEAMEIPTKARFSHFYFRDGLNFSQLDYIFVSNDLAVRGGGMLDDMVPINYEQRRRLPSDHIFLTATIALPEPSRRSTS